MQDAETAVLDDDDAIVFEVELVLQHVQPGETTDRLKGKMAIEPIEQVKPMGTFLEKNPVNGGVLFAVRRTPGTSMPVEAELPERTELACVKQGLHSLGKRCIAHLEAQHVVTRVLLGRLSDSERGFHR